jgi:hypothetical protein
MKGPNSVGERSRRVTIDRRSFFLLFFRAQRNLARKPIWVELGPVELATVEGFTVFGT